MGVLPIGVVMGVVPMGVVIGVEPIGVVMGVEPIGVVVGVVIGIIIGVVGGAVTGALATGFFEPPPPHPTAPTINANARPNRNACVMVYLERKRSAPRWLRLWRFKRRMSRKIADYRINFQPPASA